MTRISTDTYLLIQTSIACKLIELGSGVFNPANAKAAADLILKTNDVQVVDVHDSEQIRQEELSMKLSL